MEEPRTHIHCWVIGLGQPEKLHKRDDKLKEGKGFGKYPKAGEVFPKTEESKHKTPLEIQQNRKYSLHSGRIQD